MSLFFLAIQILFALLLIGCSYYLYVSQRQSRLLSEALEEKNAFIRDYLATYTEGLHQQEHFLSQIHHDVKGPLHSILVISELLQAEVNDEMKLTQLQLIHSSATRLHQQLQQALALSPHWQTYYLPENEARAPLQLEEWLREWVANFESNPSRAQTQIVFESQLLLPYLISHGEPLKRMIEPVLINSTRGENVKITLTSSIPSEITLRVENDGPSVPEALLPFVCYPFVKHPQQNQGNLGLGLYQTARFAQMLGARFSLQNVQPSGVRVELTWKR